MNRSGPWPEGQTGNGVLIDTNLLVLLVVGLVNPRRIEAFKRTRQYTAADFRLLNAALDGFRPLYATPQIAAEVSNLTDLGGIERVAARNVLKTIVNEWTEPVVTSVAAVQGRFYERLGLTDSAIQIVSSEKKCSVLTDDLDLYLALSRLGVPVYNFNHLRERAWRITSRG
ncbi:MAG: hypothetical protein ABL995_06375 [Bryobacteraceae bacterium]